MQPGAPGTHPGGRRIIRTDTHSRRDLPAAALTALGVAVAYWATAQVGLRLSTISGAVSPVWPPSGVALAAVLLLGPWRAAAGVLLGSAVATLGTGVGVGPALGIALGNTLEPLVAAALLARLDFRRELARVRDVVRLALCGAVAGPLVSALCGALSLTLGGVTAPAQLGGVLSVWWVGNAMGALVLAPPLLTWRCARAVPSRRLEALAFGAVLLAALGWVFSASHAAPLAHYAQTFLLFPLLTWAALRFGPAGTALANALVAVVAVWATASGLGPFVVEAAARDVMVLQLFLGVSVLSGALLAAALAERAGVDEQVALLGTSVRSSREGVVVSTWSAADGARIAYANEAFQRMVGYRLEELVGRAPSELRAAQPAPEVDARLEAAKRAGETWQGELVLARKDGGLVHSEMVFAPVRDADGRVTHFVATHRDVTERHAMQARLLAAERVASVATLAAGVGHEINNPLAYAVFSLHNAERFLAGTPQRTPEALGAVRGAQEACERIRLIVRDLQVLSRDGRGEERAAVALEALVAPTLRLAQHALRGRARLEEVREPCPRVLGSEGRLGQVLLNLLVNAAQAIPEGDADRHVVRVRTGTHADGRALLEVQDTGCGIAPEHLQRVFEPLFTTKPQGVGTGLGLSICREIVRDHGGELTLESELGRGTLARVLLPAAPGEAPRAPATPPAPAPVRRPRVLIVDDEVRLARSMQLLLEPAHEVVCASRGREALELLKGPPGFDVVLCDLQMPDTSGMDVYAELQREAPQLVERLVFLSGGAFTHEARAFVAQVKNRVLEKPVPPQQLLAVVAEALGNGASAS